MKLNISTDIIPIGEFKSKISKWFNTAKESGHPLVITQNGKPAAVIISPEEYDNLKYTNQFVESVKRGLEDIQSGDFLETSQLKEEIRKQRMTGEDG